MACVMIVSTSFAIGASWARSVVSSSPMFVSSNTLAIDALKQMEENPKKRVSMLPVIDNKKIIGFVNLHSLVSAGIK